MPPELLVAGKLTPAADVYSFGIMMWEMVSRTPPFHGLHHGEIIHKVVTQDLRPGEDGDKFGGKACATGLMHFQLDVMHVTGPSN